MSIFRNQSSRRTSPKFWRVCWSLSRFLILPLRHRLKEGLIKRSLVSLIDGARECPCRPAKMFGWGDAEKPRLFAFEFL